MNPFTYIGERHNDGRALVFRLASDHDPEPLPLRLELACHSPSGFEWGYGGSGPAQLALALLADALGNDQQALRWYQPFKLAVIAALPHPSWLLRATDIEQALAQLRAADQAHNSCPLPAEMRLPPHAGAPHRK